MDGYLGFRRAVAFAQGAAFLAILVALDHIVFNYICAVLFLQGDQA